MYIIFIYFFIFLKNHSEKPYLKIAKKYLQKKILYIIYKKFKNKIFIQTNYSVIKLNMRQFTFIMIYRIIITKYVNQLH